MAEKHIFALHFTQVIQGNQLTVGARLAISDFDLWHRVVHVLHAGIGQNLIIFNDAYQIHITLEQISKKGSIDGTIIQVLPLRLVHPEIILYQGLIKRDALDSVAYFAAQMGITSLRLSKTEKVQRGWGGAKELERMRKVMVAACEQSKQFVIPQIQEPVDLEVILNSLSPSPKTLSIFCEPSGHPLFDHLQALVKNSYEKINIFIGPEGGFVPKERLLLEQAGALPCALTPTILRSQEAVAVCIGAFRSVAR